MTRQLLAFCLGSCLLAALPAFEARAAELPVRKAGLWEMKTLRTGSPMPEMTIQHCTDAATDKEMSSSFSPASKEMCSKQDIQKTATGYVTDSVCSVAGVTITSHAEISGDFNSAYTVKSTSHTDRGPAAVPRDSTATIEAKWLGACKPDQKPGDIVMPGGIKMNITDMEKLKGMIPKQLPK
ncbi:DUF3617 domain-containing protein [Bradyrhizobium sediminis]|uniref:DUF3617 domain-containing protein n=1 Tax=Bradyrhizobium sediminis TaxID=2840469 RepID=A0A975RSB6_9BRAD|nr:DUF3617 family protein [Bradyrhizobium sediminis]QWG17581.1 DUF3617 domain-containing protein [Bradyrhizobium sediminis]